MVLIGDIGSSVSNKNFGCVWLNYLTILVRQIGQDTTYLDHWQRLSYLTNNQLPFRAQICQIWSETVLPVCTVHLSDPSFLSIGQICLPCPFIWLVWPIIFCVHQSYPFHIPADLFKLLFIIWLCFAWIMYMCCKLEFLLAEQQLILAKLGLF